jgi:hypothetical protein
LLRRSSDLPAFTLCLRRVYRPFTRLWRAAWGIALKRFDRADCQILPVKRMTAVDISSGFV